jgi:hypothetical protein
MAPRLNLSSEDRESLRGLFEIIRAGTVENLEAGRVSDPDEARRKIEVYDDVLAALDGGAVPLTDEIREVIAEVEGSLDLMLANLDAEESDAASGETA